MRDGIVEALETIDAMVFTGNGLLDPENMKLFCEYIERWQRAVSMITVKSDRAYPATTKVIVSQHTEADRKHIREILKPLMKTTMVYSDKRKSAHVSNIGGRSLKYILHGTRRLNMQQLSKINAHLAGLGVVLVARTVAWRPAYQMLHVVRLTA